MNIRTVVLTNDRMLLKTVGKLGSSNELYALILEQNKLLENKELDIDCRTDLVNNGKNLAYKYKYNLKYYTQKINMVFYTY